MSIDNHRFKMIDACPPPLEEGTYNVTIKQEISSPVKDTLHSNQIFCIKRAHFSLSPEEVFSVYPAKEARGDYSNCIGHITLKNKTTPWENSFNGKCSTVDSTLPVPWLALICVSAEENSSTIELSVEELLSTKGGNTFFPLTEMPSLCTEKPDTICNVLDLPLSLFEEIMPRQNELSLLTHVKLVNLYNTPDEIIPLDGYFSVVIANRFVPSNSKTQLQKSTFHLVSLEGFGDLLPKSSGLENLKRNHPEYTKIRLVSLYSWNVYSLNSEEADFVEITRNLNSKPIAIDPLPADAPLVLKRGYIPVMHITRTGESTVSLYRGPLSPYKIEETAESKKLTADGRIIYDKERGLFDMSYAAAWQLGRLLALKNKPVALAILNQQRNSKRMVHAHKNEVLLSRKMQTFTKGNRNDESDLLEFFAVLFQRIAKEELVVPVSTDNRGRDKRVRKRLSVGGGE